MNLSQLVNNLSKEIKLSPEQKFRLTAHIKRYMHEEKAKIYERWGHYLKTNGPCGRPSDPWLLKVFKQNQEQNEEMLSCTDEQIVTWDVGNHRFNRSTKFNITQQD